MDKTQGRLISGLIPGLIPGLALLFLSALLWVSPKDLGQAPDIGLSLLDGRQISLSQLRGQPVLITFWATSCAICREEIPHLIKLHTDLAPAGFEVIAIAMAYDPPNRILSFSKGEGLPYAIALDIQGEAARAFGRIEATPTSFLIGPDGRIAYRKVGKINFNALRTRIAALL